MVTKSILGFMTLRREPLTLVSPTPQPHSASKNHLRIPRFITNPPVTLKEPLNLNRANPADYVRVSSRSFIIRPKRALQG